MRQVFQNLANGKTEIVDVPVPRIPPGHLFLSTRRSLVSAGTERMLVGFGKAGWIKKARQQPDKVRQVLEKVVVDGLLPTLDAVRTKLDQPLPMGYCNVGTVIEAGPGVSGFSVGDRVASNGAHAQAVCVPRNLCAKVPDGVSDEAAAFTVLGAIALQGIRLAQPTLGEVVAVTGLGLIGLLTVQLLKAHGCTVLGIDLDPRKIELARQFGAEAVDLSRGEDPLAAATASSRGRGVDAVLITASTKSSEPVHQAALMCRKRGRIVLVGVTGLELSRADFYEKELTFQVSCSYGPGRYDTEYEQKGQDYPIGFVRWTEQRNFEAVLDMMADGRLAVAPLISHRFPIDRAGEAYRVLTEDPSALGILLEYPTDIESTETAALSDTVALATPESEAVASGLGPVVGVIGAGNYGSRVLIPAFQKAGARLKTVVSSGGASAVHAGRKFGFLQATTDALGVFSDPEINIVVVATRHDTHARYVCQALEAGKHVFVEKPLCLTRDELSRIEAVYTSQAASTHPPLLMVDFNRRFAPQVKRIKGLLDIVREPKVFVMTVNAGEIPPHHWTQDREVGGGRIIGEGCHFVDLLRFLADHPIGSVQATAIGRAHGVAVREDKASVTLTFTDGSFGTVHYLANGHRSFPKERLEVFCAGRVLQLDNFRKLRGYGWPGFRRSNLWRQDKGQAACAKAFLDAVQHGGAAPIPFAELVEVAQTTLEIAALLARG